MTYFWGPNGFMLVVLILSTFVAGGAPGMSVGDQDAGAGARRKQPAVSQTVTSQCQDIKVLVLANKGEDAARRLDQLLHGVGGSDAADVSDQILHFLAELETSGHPRKSHDLEKPLVLFLAEKPKDRQVPYRALQEALFRGQNEFLMEYGRQVKPLDWQSHQLVAEAAADEFLGLNCANPTEETRERLKRIAKVCTDHYEAAILQAPDQYVKTQLACGWLAMKASYGRRFDTDSLLIRKQFPTHPAFDGRASKEAIRAQAQRIRAALRAAIDSGRQGRLFAENTRTIIVESLMQDFEVYAQIGIPDQVIDRLTKDIAFFFDTGMAMRRIQDRGMTQLHELAPTFKWYLWRAIVCPTPDGVEQEEIRVQVNRVAEHCLGTLAAGHMPAELSRSAGSYMERFRLQYRDLRFNRFVPYFKRVLSKNRFKDTMAQAASACNQLNVDFTGLSGKQFDKDFGAEQATVNAYIKDYGFAVFVSALTWYSCWDRPVRTHLPGWIIDADAAEVNEYYVYTFLPTLGEASSSDPRAEGRSPSSEGM